MASTGSDAAEERAVRIDRFGVAALLRELGELLALDGANPFRARAYARGAQTLEAMGGDFEAMLRSGQLAQLPGIGAALAGTIEQLASSGRTDTLERLRRQRDAQRHGLRSASFHARYGCVTRQTL